MYLTILKDKIRMGVQNGKSKIWIDLQNDLEVSKIKKNLLRQKSRLTNFGSLKSVRNFCLY